MNNIAEKIVKHFVPIISKKNKGAKIKVAVFESSAISHSSPSSLKTIYSYSSTP